MSIRKHPVAYLALFIALGGTSYAATQLPPNSVGTDQLAFPLGMASARPGPERVGVSCARGRGCLAVFRPLASVRISLKKPSQLLVLFQARAAKPASPGHTSPLFVELTPTPPPPLRRMGYQLSTRPTSISYTQVIRRPAGSQTISVSAFIEQYRSDHHLGRFVSVDDPQLTVIALPPLR